MKRSDLLKEFCFAPAILSPPLGEVGRGSGREGVAAAMGNAVKDFHTGKQVGRNNRSAVPARIAEDAPTHCRNRAAKIV